MASFVDQIPTFNPYIQQLPVEDMVTVGMEKQRRYDEGIQKIQSQIDNIAGLDVVRGIDRKYLQSKLNQLGNQLRTVAAGDFSNFQLVNSTSGMVNQLTKDKYIQNAVRSTGMYRKALENREAYQKEGKTSPSNDWLFNMEVNDWMNSKSIDSQFSSDYRPYTDWKANAREILKSIKEDAVISDDAFMPDGSLADAVIREQFKGIRPEKIQQALLEGLTPADFQQMQIDGRYQYSNYSAEEFVKSVNDSYSQRFDQISDKRTQLLVEKDKTSDAEEKSEFEKRIVGLDNDLNRIQKEYDNIAQTFQSGDLESAKARLFTTNFMTNFSLAHSYSEISKTYENSPLADAAWRRNKLYLELKQRDDHHRDNLAVKWAAHSLQERKFEKEFPSDVRPLSEGLTADSITRNDIINSIDDLKIKLNREKGNILELSGNYTPEEVTLFLKYANGEKLSNEDNKKALEMDKYLTGLEMNSNNGSMNDILLSSAFDSLKGIQSRLDFQMNTYNSILNDADSKPEFDIPSALSKLTPVSFRQNNVEYNYTPEELISSYKNIFKYVTSSRDPVLEISKYKFDDEGAMANLSPKELAIYNVYKKKHSGGALFTHESKFYRAFEDYNKQGGSIITKKTKQKETYINEKVNERFAGMQPVTHTIPLANKEDKDRFVSQMQVFLTRSKNQKGGLPEGENINDLEKIIGALTSANVKVQQFSDFQEPSYRIELLGGKSDKPSTAGFNISHTNFVEMFGYKYLPNPYEQSFYRIEKRLTASKPTAGGVRTTATDGEIVVTESNAYLDKKDFPSLNSYKGIKANVIESNYPNGEFKYVINAIIYNPKTREWSPNINLNKDLGLLNYAQVVNLMNVMNDVWVDNLLNPKKK